MEYQVRETIYENPLAAPGDVKGFAMEGEAAITFPVERMRMENMRDPEEGQAANFVYWCPEIFPDSIAISWDFWPVREPGLCILFFAATARDGGDIFDSSLKGRTGEYHQYHNGDINALHVSYFRRKAQSERTFQTCNMRKSYGFHLVCQGADPLPSIPEAAGPYRVKLVKRGPEVLFSVRDLPVFHWIDAGKEHGPVLTGGRIGFRQMAPLIGEYANLKVESIA